MAGEEREFKPSDLFIPLTNKKAILWITAIGFLVYFNALFGQFVWDDNGQIVDSTYTKGITYIPQLFINPEFDVFYRPVFFSFLTIVKSTFGLNVFFFHFLQILIHVANSIMVFLLFVKFFDKKLSFILSLVFLVHPINTEAVAYASAVSDPLFMFFGLLALHMMIKEKLSIYEVLTGCLFVLLSLLTKEAGVLFIPVILIYRLVLNKSSKILIFSSLFITVFLYLFLRIGIGNVHIIKPELAPIARLALEERIYHIPAIIFYYLKTFIFPLHLSINQFWIVNNLSISHYYIPFSIIACLAVSIGFFIFFIKKNSTRFFFVVLFFLCWFLVGISLYLQIIPLDMTVADRWFYFPLVGLLGIVGVVLSSFKTKKRNLKLFYIIAFVILLLFSVRTIIRNNDWRDPVTLYGHDSKIHTNFDTENNLGNAYVSSGNYEDAYKHFQKSVDLFPYETNLFNLGISYERKGDLKKAQEYYQKALKKDHYLTIPQKHLSHTYVRASYVFLLQEDYDAAKKQALQGLEEYPDNVNLWIILATSEYKLGNKGDALNASEKAKSLSSHPNVVSLYEKIVNDQEVDIPAQ